jgi:Winged helix DNA-binding domain
VTLTASLIATRDRVMRYRARVSYLDAKLSAGSYAKAAWGGLQDSVPRAGVISLHARVENTRPDAWEDPSVVQIWFRGGADYLVPREDAGIFTLGSSPRDPAQAAELDRLADDVHRVTEGRTLTVNEVSKLLGHPHQLGLRVSGLTGRIHIRWDASRIWLIPVERPDIDADDARRELAHRFLHWFGPTTKPALARWTGVSPREATATWKAVESELAPVEVDGQRRFMLAADIDALDRAEPVSGVRLLPYDDPFTKLDHELLVPDKALRPQVLPRGSYRGYIPGAILVDGEIIGAWQRQQRRVTIHPFGKLSAPVRDAIEQEAIGFPIDARSRAAVSWDVIEGRRRSPS